MSLALNPEFLREGSAIADHEDPELIVFATEHEPAAALVEALYAEQRERLHRTDPATAEVLKLVNNAWHALKVAFANEVARVTRPIGVDPFAVMELLCADTQLNTSAPPTCGRDAFRRRLPGQGRRLARQPRRGTRASTRRSSTRSCPRTTRIWRTWWRAVMAHAPKQVAIVGVGFKQGASDVRDSAPVRLVHRLLDAGRARGGGGRGHPRRDGAAARRRRAPLGAR